MKKCFKVRQFIFLILFTCTLPVVYGQGQVSAGEQQKDTLATVDTLIAERKYDEAILMLTEFIKKIQDVLMMPSERLQKIIKLTGRV